MEKSIEQKCIDEIVEKDRLNWCPMQELKEFLKQHFDDVEIKSRIRKPEMMRMAYERLTPETLTTFIDGLPQWGLSKNDIAEIYECTLGQVKTILGKGLITKVGEVNKNKYSVRYLYSIRDVVNLYKEGKTPKQTARKVDIPLTNENIEEALYIINKSAKKSRDTKNWGYQYRHHSICHAAKTRCRNLYHLKDAVISKLKDEERIRYQGVEKQEIEGRTVFLDYYTMDNFSFHTRHIGEVEVGEVLPTTIVGEISAERTRPTTLNFTEAVWVLENYSGVKATGTYNRKNYYYY